MFEQLKQAANLGMVQVTAYSSGHIVRGARGDLLLESELEQMGAEWREKLGAYYVPKAAAVDDIAAMARSSKAAAAALASRAKQAQTDGLNIFDRERGRQQRKATREIREVYRGALAEHAQEINAVSALLRAGKPDDMDAGEWARIVAARRETLAELNAVYDELAAGMARAGESAQQLMNGQLAESQAIARNVCEWQLDNMSGVRVSRFIAHDTAALATTGLATYHGKYDLKAWKGVSNRAQCRRAIKKAVSRGLLTGEHPEKIATRIEGLFRGTEPLSPHARAVRIARTETASIMSQATQETIEAIAAEGLVKVRNRWDATLDGSTRDDHRRVDGEVVEAGKKFSNGLRRPGDGGAADRINCRCSLVPVLDGFEPNNPMRRENSTGKMIPYQTYSEWEAAKNQTIKNTTYKQGLIGKGIKEELNTIDEKTIRRVYGKADSQNYTAIKGDDVHLKGSNVGRVAKISENESKEFVTYHALPRSSGFVNGKYVADDNQNAILTGGRVVLTNDAANNNSFNVIKSMVEDELDRVAGIRQDGVFYRGTNNKKEVGFLKAGTIRRSVNHLENTIEDGLSVWERPKYAFDYIYKIEGEVVGIGSDGEPLIDVKSIILSDEKPVSMNEIYSAREKAKEDFKKTYNWTDEQLDSVLKDGYAKRGDLEIE